MCAATRTGRGRRSRRARSRRLAARSNTYSTASPPSAAADAPAARPTRHAYVTVPPAARAPRPRATGEATVRTVTLCGSTRCARPPSAASSVCRGSGGPGGARHEAELAARGRGGRDGGAIRIAAEQHGRAGRALPERGRELHHRRDEQRQAHEGHQLRGERGSGRGEVAGRAAAPYIGAGAIFRAPGVY